MSGTPGTFTDGHNLYMGFKIEKVGGTLTIADKVQFVTGPDKLNDSNVTKLTGGDRESVGDLALAFAGDGTKYTIDAGAAAPAAVPAIGATSTGSPAGAPDIANFNTAGYTKKFSIKADVDINTGMNGTADLTTASYTISTGSIVEITTNIVNPADAGNNTHSVAITDSTSSPVTTLTDVKTSSIEAILAKFNAFVTAGGGKRARRKSSKRKSAKHKRGGRRGRRKSNKRRR